jgi:hypothetical protein
MSTAFQLDFTGPQTPCDFPGCILESFHDGDHKRAEKTPVKWTYDRHCVVCGVPFTVLGAEAKQIFDTCGSEACLLHYARRHAATLAPVQCTCAQRPHPHEVSVHKKVGHESPGVYYDYYDLPIRFAPKEMKWPWSLRFVGNGGEM